MTMRETMFKATCIRKRCHATWCYIDKRCHATWCYIHKSVTQHNVRLTRDVTLDDVTHTHTRDVKLHEVRFRRDVTLHDLTYTQDVALHDVRWERESHCQNLELKLRRKTPRLETKDSFHVTKLSPDCQTGERIILCKEKPVVIYMQFTTSIIIIIISLLDTARSLYIKHY